MADAASAATRTQAAMSPPAFVPVTLVNLGPAAPEPTTTPSAPELVTVEIRLGSTSVPMDVRNRGWCPVPDSAIVDTK